MPGLTWFFNLAVNHTIVALIVVFFFYIVGVAFLLYINDFPRKRKYCTSKAKLDGKTVIITGKSFQLHKF